MASTAAVRAAEVVARASSTSSDSYEEVAGTWADSETASKVAGLPEGKARALQANSEGKAIGAAVFKLKVPEAGKYFLDIAYPENANAEDAAVAVTGTSEPLLRFVDMAPAPDQKAMADKWVRVASFDAIAAGDVQVRIEPNIESKPVVAGQPFLLAVDSVRITTEDTGTVNADVVTDPSGSSKAAGATADGDSPFAVAAAASNPADSPFEMPDEPKDVAAPAAVDTPEDDPFATKDEKKDADPFSDAAAPAAAAPAAAVAAAPAAALPESGTDSPFSGAADAAAKVDDPFASAPPSDAVASAPAQPAAAPNAKDDPFADAGASNAFAPSGSTAAEAASSPFEGTAAAGAAAPAAANDDPFATSVGSAPVEVAAAAPATAPTGDDPFAAPSGSTGEADPFAISGVQAPADAPVAPAAAADPQAVNPFVDGNPLGAANAPAQTAAAPDGAPAATGTAPFMPMEAAAIEVAAAAAAEPPAEPSVELKYRASIQEALETSRKTDRPVLILFTGESATATAVEATMSRPKVAEELGAFELVKVDYRANRALARKYAVSSYPYMVVMNKHGYTEGHVIPTAQEEALIRKLTPFVQAYF